MVFDKEDQGVKWLGCQPNLTLSLTKLAMLQI
jgi:hypothetical protein